MISDIRYVMPQTLRGSFSFLASMSVGSSVGLKRENSDVSFFDVSKKRLSWQRLRLTVAGRKRNMGTREQR